MNHTSWRHGVTRYQWLVLLVAWLGWVFDSMDATIYAIVLHPALEELLRTSVADGLVSHEVIGWYGGLIFSIFLIGWAVGGVLFGIVADYFGRTKTLIITILVYSLFTGLAALSDTWWHLAIYRFVTALGIGGEWAAGAVIVAEVWPEEKRAKAAGILQSAWAAGFFLAASINLLAGSVSSRHPAGLHVSLHLYVGGGTRSVGQVPLARTPLRRGTAGETPGPVQGKSSAPYVGRVIARLRGSLRTLGRDQLGADTGAGIPGLTGVGPGRTVHLRELCDHGAQSWGPRGLLLFRPDG